MKPNVKVIIIAAVAVLAVLLLVVIAPHQTKPTEVGVRVIKWSPFEKSGVVQDVYAPGATYFFPRIINEWHVFDTKLQNIEMTYTQEGGNRSSRDDLLFKTIDGNDISLDVIIAYRIDPKKAPYLLVNIADDNKDIEENLVRPLARNLTRDLFGELTTEDFYNADKRTQKSEYSKTKLNEILNPYGIIVESVLPKDYRFNEAYQKAIEDKKIADQVAERFKSEANAIVEEYNQRLEAAQGEVNKMVADIDGEYGKNRIAADAYFEQQSKIAKAIEAEGLAEAKGVEKLVQAVNSSGGDTMVKMKIAQALQGKKIFLLPFGDSGGLDVKTTDINELLKVYGAQKLAGQ